MGFRIRSGLLTSLVAVLVAAFPAVSEAAFPGENGKIAFASYRGSPFISRIWTINPDGTGLTVLTSKDTSLGWPAWSPDGTRLAVARGLEYPSDVTPILDGTRLAVRAGPNNGAPGIETMNPDGTGVTRLTSDSAVDVAPSWSPDGKKIAFASGRGGNLAIYTMNAADGSQVTRLTKSPGIDSSPVYSPDGTKIAFHRTTVEAGVVRVDDLYLMNADGTEQRRLDTGVNWLPLEGPQNSVLFGSPSHPDWSPDGRKIAFDGRRILSGYAGQPYSSQDIYTINPDASGLARTTDAPPWPPVSSFDPAWSPDATKFAYSGLQLPQHWRLYVMNADGTDQTPITSEPEQQPIGFGLPIDSSPDWQPIPNDPSRFRNRPAFCRAQRGALGDDAFLKRYGTFGKCVSRAGR